MKINLDDLDVMFKAEAEREAVTGRRTVFEEPERGTFGHASDPARIDTAIPRGNQTSPTFPRAAPYINDIAAVAI